MEDMHIAMTESIISYGEQRPCLAGACGWLPSQEQISSILTGSSFPYLNPKVKTNLLPCVNRGSEVF